MTRFIVVNQSYNTAMQIKLGNLSLSEIYLISSQGEIIVIRGSVRIDSLLVTSKKLKTNSIR